MRTLIILHLCFSILSIPELMAQDDSFPHDRLLANTIDLDRFQAYVDSIEKYLYLDTDSVDMYFENCKYILQQNIPLPDSSLFDYVIQEIYYAHAKDEALAAFQIIEANQQLVESEEIPQKLKNNFIYMKGFTSMALGDLTLARKIFYEIIDRGEQQRDTAQMVSGLFSLGQLLSDEKEFKEAIQCFNKLLSFRDDYLPPGTFSLINFELSEVYSRSQQKEKALALIDTTLKFLEEERLYILKPDFLLLKGEKRENENRILAVQVAKKISQNTLLYVLTALFGLGILILFVAFYQKRRFNRKLREEVSNQTLQLEHANTQLINTNHELDEFNRILSHDLKEPIRNLVGFSTLLKKRGVQSQEAEEYLGYIEQSGKQLYETLSAVSAFQNTVPQEMSVTASIDFAELFENIIEKKQRENPNKNIKFSSVDLPLIHTCRSAIRNKPAAIASNLKTMELGLPPSSMSKYLECLSDSIGGTDMEELV